MLLTSFHVVKAVVGLPAWLVFLKAEKIGEGELESVFCRDYPNFNYFRGLLLGVLDSAKAKGDYLNFIAGDSILPNPSDSLKFFVEANEACLLLEKNCWVRTWESVSFLGANGFIGYFENFICFALEMYKVSVW